LASILQGRRKQDVLWRCGSSIYSHTATATDSQASSPDQEKTLEEVGAFLGHESAYHLRPMVQARIAKEIIHRPGHTGLIVIRTKHDAAHLGQHDRAGALRTRLQSYIQRGEEEPVLADFLESTMQRQQLRVSGGIPALHRFVMSFSQQFTLCYDHRSDRNLLSD
jgi:hypothetical protein